MKFVRLFFRYVIYFFLISVIVAGNTNTDTLILCAIVSSIASLLIPHIFRLPSKIDIHFFKVFSFIWSVIVSIYTSTVKTLAFNIKYRGKMPTVIEKLPLKTKSGVYRLFICQAITLNPGTVSVKSKSGSVSVLKVRTDTLQIAQNFDKKLETKS